MTSEVEKLKSANKFLTVALIVAAFLLGSLTNKVATLEKNGTPTITGTDAKQPSQGNSPAPTLASKKPKAVSASDHISGNKNAKITLITYTDLECPFCQRFHPTTQELLKAYADKIRLVYRHYPLPFHQNALKEAEASECIAELGGNDSFRKYIDIIFERTTANGTGFAQTLLGPLAAELGINQERFQTCLDSGKYEKLVKDSIAEGKSAGVSGTPSTFIIDSEGNSQLIVGAQPIEAFKTEIDKLLK